MTTEETLFELIKVGLGSITTFNLPEKVNWSKLIEIATKQGVVAIAFSGYQKLNQDSSISHLEIMKWLGISTLVQQKCKDQLDSASELSKVWKEYGIRTLVLKGFAFSYYYPIPYYRPSNDLDCYLCNRYDEGNKVVEALGGKVNYKDYRHSTFFFKKVHVENHKICTTVRGKSQRKCFERYLRILLETKQTNSLFNTNLEQPCLMFNALFFLQHSHRHFLREGFQLRYICDWAMLIKAMLADASFDFKEFWCQCKLNDLELFANSMSRLAYHVCGIRAPWVCSEALLIQDTMLLNDCFNIPKNAIKYGNDFIAHLQMVRNMFNQRWKYYYFSEDSFIKDVIISWWCIIFEKNPRI